MKILNMLKDKILWTVYYRYQYLIDVDETGPYTISQKLLMFLRITHDHIFGKYWNIQRLKHSIIYDCNEVSDVIYKELVSDKPSMIARYGFVELNVVANYKSIISKRKNVFNCVRGKCLYWWWNKQMKKGLFLNAGFFPNEPLSVSKFCDLMIDNSKFVDILETWIGLEPLLIEKVCMVGLQESEPWWQQNPWTRALKNKRIVVVHPFAELIESQYKKRNSLFVNSDVLPDFHLRTVKAVQSIGGCSDKYDNWFDALDWMKSEINKEDYDIALIGCGAYGFVLAAYVKQCGKKAVHMGGVLQLLFGIKGARWEDKKYHSSFDYTTLFNENWVRPSKLDTPLIAKQIENSCYW
jgi:hypothetical protein